MEAWIVIGTPSFTSSVDVWQLFISSAAQVIIMIIDKMRFIIQSFYRLRNHKTPARGHIRDLPILALAGTDDPLLPDLDDLCHRGLVKSLLPFHMSFAVLNVTVRLFPKQMY